MDNKATRQKPLDAIGQELLRQLLLNSSKTGLKAWTMEPLVLGGLRLLVAPYVIAASNLMKGIQNVYLIYATLFYAYAYSFVPVQRKASDDDMVSSCVSKFERVWNAQMFTNVWHVNSMRLPVQHSIVSMTLETFAPNFLSSAEVCSFEWRFAENVDSTLSYHGSIATVCGTV